MQKQTKPFFAAYLEKAGPKTQSCNVADLNVWTNKWPSDNDEA